MNVQPAQGARPVPQRVSEIQREMAALLGTSTAIGGASSPLGFGHVLDRQLEFGGSSNDTARLTPAARLPAGAYGSLQPPAELVRYGNGQIPTDALAPVGIGNHRLWEPAADSMRTLVGDAAAEGITIGMTDSYRPLNVQERLAREKGLYSQGGLAAVPGTSNHGWGMATDLDLDDRALAWMRENGWKYGFVEDVPREPWHWTYRPEQ